MTHRTRSLFQNHVVSAYYFSTSELSPVDLSLHWRVLHCSLHDWDSDVSFLLKNLQVPATHRLTLKLPSNPPRPFPWYKIWMKEYHFLKDACFPLPFVPVWNENYRMMNRINLVKICKWSYAHSRDIVICVIMCWGRLSAITTSDLGQYL